MSPPAIVDRERQRLHVLTEPDDDGCAAHQVHAPGHVVAFPQSIGARVSLDVSALLDAAGARS